LSPEFDDYHVGDPACFKLDIVNRNSTHPMKLPALIGTKFETVQLKITRPDRQSYFHRSKKLTCGHGHRELDSGRSYSCSLAFIDGPGGAVFPTPGDYVFEAALPTLGLISDPVEIIVKPASRPELDNPRFRSFLSKGLPFGHSVQWKRLIELLKDPGMLSPQTHAHLAYLAAIRRPRFRQAKNMWAMAASKEAPLRTREKAALVTLKQRLFQRPKSKETVHAEIDKVRQSFPDQPPDSPIHEAIDVVRASMIT
jgi:hypothetical protein